MTLVMYFDLSSSLPLNHGKDSMVQETEPREERKTFSYKIEGRREQCLKKRNTQEKEVMRMKMKGGEKQTVRR